MPDKTRIRQSKLLALVLRHDPGAIGLALDAAGWAELDALVSRCRAHGHDLDHEAVLDIVRTSDKQRFALSEDGRRIRANQGHSLAVELGYAASVPPDVLFHGTTAASLPAIRATGLARMARLHVHLSADVVTAQRVGGRRGRAIVLSVAAGRMHAAGHVFMRSDNGVWLTEAVPPEYLTFPPLRERGPRASEPGKREA